MKISCPTCAAKYTIADEKARGRSVKIKCKKCGTSILVGGDEGASATWSVNIGEADVRTLPVEQIAALVGDGTVTHETFVWREGMADWLPISAVPELRDALAEKAAALADEDMPTRMGEVPPELLAMGRGDQPAAAKRAPRPGGDLFGGAPATAAPIDEDMVTRMASPKDHARAPSVAPPRASGPAAPVQPAARASGPAARNVPAPRKSFPPPAAASAPVPAALASAEASGLIDIRTLQAALKGQQSAPDKKKADDKLDDIMSLGVGSPLFVPAPSFAPIDLNAPSPEEPPPPPPPQAAPAFVAAQGALIPIPEPPPKKKTGLIIGGVVGVVALLALAVGMTVMITKKGDSGDKVAGTPPPPDKVAAADSPAPNANPGDAKTVDAPPPAAPADATAAATADPVTGPLKKDDKDKKKKKGDDDKKDKKDDKKDDPKPPPPPKEEKKDDPPPAAGGGSDANFSVGAASAALGGIAGGVGSCKKPDGPTGSGRAAVTFANSGSVSSVTLDPPFGGTPTGNCIQGRFRGAKVPAFGGSPQTVKKSFSVN